MNRVAVFSIVPVLFVIVGALANIKNSVPPISTERPTASPVWFAPSNSYSASDSTTISRAPAIAANPAQASNLTNSPIRLSDAEISQHSSDRLLALLLDFRAQRLFEANFLATENELFKRVLSINPVAAIDYLIAIAYDPSSRYYVDYLYRDFMLKDQQSHIVSNYVNRYGPHPLLLQLLTDAQRAHEVSPQVRHEVLNEFILGNAEYYDVMSSAGWVSELSENEIIQGFNNTVPAFLQDPFTLIGDVLRYEHSAAYAQLGRYILEHPEKYRLYHVIDRNSDMPLAEVVFELMSQFNSYQGEEKIQVALIALDFGYYEALEFLLAITQEPLTTTRPLNVSYVILSHIKTPDYVDKSLDWVRKNAHKLSFNPFTKQFDY